MCFQLRLLQSGRLLTCHQSLDMLGQAAGVLSCQLAIVPRREKKASNLRRSRERQQHTFYSTGGNQLPQLRPTMPLASTDLKYTSILKAIMRAFQHIILIIVVTYVW
ncbi:hypothetical protein PHLGIDRAFT_229909 [Phlebiopsis gigantea 11061_1 CR5-6]|uniref:Uncharacterized protein n=1 Tax=Phlebiopsis gigantea (strain 11061_1 CR5-6) TaxID=745531 RepID=A0A0C3SBY5_PHLG1|nr:hypothetical protein PHLGIDRAFT_229909 [Phlebiopsis gigantea 11061_1 CR5-6]